MATSNELAFTPASPPKQNATRIDDIDDFVEVPSPARRSDCQYAPQPRNKDQEGHGIYKQWIANSSAKHSSPGLFGADALRKLYPKHSIVATKDYGLNILGFPDAHSQPISIDELVTNVFFIPLARRAQGGGVLLDSVEFGCFRTAWGSYEFTVYIVKYVEGFSVFTQHFILHDGDERPIRDFLIAAGSWSAELHEEIWVYNQGFWKKDYELWTEVQKADWEEIILDEEFKSALQKDVFSFFTSEELYRKLAIPWKRGLILYGPPGNGKTISVKAVMKSIINKGYVPLYVKSFQSWQGEEAAMQQVFDKARQSAPCVIVLEDLDSLINDRNRSFFLNQMDGLTGNDGLLVIATTNHFDRLDPGLSTRPSRFDRKYNFDDPSVHERLLYAKFWQEKLSDNDKVEFPDSLAQEVADATNGFSFAYLKEAFVSTLVIMASEEPSQPSFSEILKRQIKALRKQLDQPLLSANTFSPRSIIRTSGVQHHDTHPPSTRERNSLQWETGRSVALSAIALGRRYVY